MSAHRFTSDASASPHGRDTTRGNPWTSVGALALLLLLAASACTEEAPVEILDPPRGAMLPAGESVAVRVRGELQFRAVLHDVDVDYTATTASFSSTGTARFDTITVQGTVAVTASDVTLENLQATASDPVITDFGSLPQQAVQPLADQLKSDVPGAVADAAQGVADHVFSQLITSLRPQVGLALAHPVTQETQVEDLVQEPSDLALTYSTRIRAEQPSVARADQQVLARQDTASTGDGTGLTVRVGRALVNQYAFALWHAGNFSGLTYTQEELEALGMEPLEFPYSNLNHATISLLLPPLLEFGREPTTSAEIQPPSPAVAGSCIAPPQSQMSQRSTQSQ